MMRKSPALDALFPKIRQAILATTLMQPERTWYMSDLARHLGVTPSSLQRELAGLVQAGILRRRQDGNRAYYQADPECPLLPELRGLMAKTAGLADVLRHVLRPYTSGIRLALVYGSVARFEERSGSDVDLLVVGTVGLSELSPALRKAESRLQRAVNPIVYSTGEFATKVKSGHHLLTSILNDEVIYLIGNECELESLTHRKPHPHPRHKQKGTEDTQRTR